MASRSRRGGGGRGAEFAVWFFVIIGLLVAFFQIPYDPGARGIIEVVISKSKTVQTWTEGVVPGIEDFFVGIIEGGDPAPVPNPGEVPPANPNPGTLPEEENLTNDEATSALNSLTVRNPTNASYNRDDWKHWVNIRSCWSVREEVLSLEATPGSLQLKDSNGNATDNLANACEIVAGEWIDPYSGKTFTNPSDLDVDHMIPLSYANSAGGSEWDSAKKQDYANSLTYPNHLIAVDKGENRSKSDKGPGEWKPSNTAHHCQYAKDWIAISTTWNLTVSNSDVAALKEMLGTC